MNKRMLKVYTLTLLVIGQCTIKAHGGCGGGGWGGGAGLATGLIVGSAVASSNRPQTVVVQQPSNAGSSDNGRYDEMMRSNEELRRQNRELINRLDNLEDERSSKKRPSKSSKNSKIKKAKMIKEEEEDEEDGYQE